MPTASAHPAIPLRPLSAERVSCLHRHWDRLWIAGRSLQLPEPPIDSLPRALHQNKAHEAFRGDRGRDAHRAAVLPTPAVAALHSASVRRRAVSVYKVVVVVVVQGRLVSRDEKEIAKAFGLRSGVGEGACSSHDWPVLVRNASSC